MNDNRLILLFCGIAFAWIASACGNPPTAAEETQTAAVAAATPQVTIAVPAPSPISVPGNLAEATAALVTPAAAGADGARADCPTGFATYRDVAGVLSLCAPAGLSATSVITNRGAPAITLGNNLNGVNAPDLPQLAISVGLTDRPDFSLTAQLADFCRQNGIPGQTIGEEAHITVGQFATAGCHYVAAGATPDASEEQLHLVGEVVAVNGLERFLSVIVGWQTNSPGAKDMADQILASLRVGR